RSTCVNGRAEVVAFLRDKWRRELDYRLKKELWAFTGNRLAVRFEYEFHDASGQWYRAYGNENWEFDGHGYMQRRFASINDRTITEADRKFRWPHKSEGRLATSSSRNLLPAVMPPARRPRA
ncbi:MAG: DUF1348 family protein, partial [bacterium]|nr:DUF1348 family protein [bacterium]